MKRIVRLTERDLTRIVRRVINEQSDTPECSSLMESSGMVGGPIMLQFPGSNVTVKHFTDGGPRYEAMVFNIKNRPYCKVSGRLNTDEFDWEIPSDDEVGSSKYLELFGDVTLEHFIDGGPSYERWTIKQDGDYVASFKKR